MKRKPDSIQRKLESILEETLTQFSGLRDGSITPAAAKKLSLAAGKKLKAIRARIKKQK